MKTVILICCALTLAGCDKLQQATNSTDQPPVTMDLLKSGAPQTCSQGDVRDTVISLVKPKFEAGVVNYEMYSAEDMQTASGFFSYSLDLITLSSVDKAVQSISCDANLIVHMKDHEDREFQITYTVRPSVEDPANFIISGDTGLAAQYVVQAMQEQAALIHANNDMARQAQQPQPAADNTAMPSDQNTPSPPSLASNLEDSSDSSGASDSQSSEDPSQ